MADAADDAVNRILQQWANERPELDASAMGPVGRMGRCAALLRAGIEQTLGEFGLAGCDFDVLATLRRSGAPYTLSPTELIASMMISSGTMTHRLQKLEAAGLVERLPNPLDARSQLVRLSAAGLTLIDEAVVAHVATLERMLGGLSAAQREQLDALLTLWLSQLENHAA